MTDLRQYSDSELSLVVMNEEYLYRHVRRHRNLDGIREFLGEMFIFTDDQWADLVETVEADWAEDAN